MSTFKLIMYVFYAAVSCGLVGVGIWYLKKKKEGGE